MKNLKFFFIGLYFGIVLTKTEMISWFRIQEMLHFHSMHIYGVIGTAVLTGIVSVFIISAADLKTWNKEKIRFPDKQSYKGLFPGGVIFGLGWSLTGADPAAMVALLGNGIWVMLVGLFSAIVGTFVYSTLRNKLP